MENENGTGQRPMAFIFAIIFGVMFFITAIFLIICVCKKKKGCGCHGKKEDAELTPIAPASMTDMSRYSAGGCNCNK